MSTQQSEGPAPRRILVTGANRGIGLHLAAALLEQGHQVWGSARQSSPEALLALSPAGTIQLDLGDETGIVAAIADLASQTDALDVLVNCAGTDIRGVSETPEVRSPLDLAGDTLTDLLRLNVTGPMVTTREAMPLLRKGVEPVVLNISSQMGSIAVASKMGSDAAYCVSKGALNMLSVKTAGVLRDEGIAVVALHPGWVQTDMGGSAAQLTPEESAAAIADTLATLTIEDSGRFIRWDGTDHPW